MNIMNIWERVCEAYGIDSTKNRLSFSYEDKGECNERIWERRFELERDMYKGLITEHQYDSHFIPGRVTVCKVTNNGKCLAYGFSYCNPSDKYDKKIGRKEAFDDMMDRLREALKQ